VGPGACAKSYGFCIGNEEAPGEAVTEKVTPVTLVIGATFSETAPHDTETVVPGNGTTVPFSSDIERHGTQQDEDSGT
jgi:hypothetical protein